MARSLKNRKFSPFSFLGGAFFPSNSRGKGDRNMEKKLLIRGCIAILALLLLSSTSIVRAKELSDLRCCNSRTSMSFTVISWHSFSSMANDSEEDNK